ncbi:ATP-binding protein [Thalassolituus hydrocarboniclasticus]|uniref:histidine kinase n=1 Tax=Thalassolituus hydrocarboniclasticus TaxID=2742796 RepID=A0ABY6A5F2_9GAMM|nr:ATP-binding protein [Thalassolituus hydrocarboniclasticus]UXD86314.1 histidine kinase [Thalassolituus hydrocarboniclasticus]
MLNSLRARLMLFTTLLLAVLMLGVGVWLYQSFYYAQVDGLQERLRLHGYSLLALADYRSDRLWIPDYLPEERFNRQRSGLYALVLDSDSNVVWRSLSAQDLPPVSGSNVQPGEWRYSLAWMQGEEYMIARLGVSWGDAGNNNPQFNLLMIENLQDFNRQLVSYRNSMDYALLTFALLLIGMQLIILRWGLAPLRRVSKDLEKLQRGEQADLTGDYPRELQPLTTNLNQLLQSERSQRERYRNMLADLSHSLKTPLAVMSGMVRQPQLSSDDKQELERQINTMSERIRFQLQRAVTQAQSFSLHKVAVKPVAESLLGVMKKVYADKQLALQLVADDDVVFWGDDNDLTEIIGNLLDNACKYGHRQVLVSAHNTLAGWQLCVEDDGPGIAEDQRERILQRGVRLDTMTAGQGLGLALVCDILAFYNARLSIRDSLLGGACFILEFEYQGTL